MSMVEPSMGALAEWWAATPVSSTSDASFMDGTTELLLGPATEMLAAGGLDGSSIEAALGNLAVLPGWSLLAASAAVVAAAAWSRSIFATVACGSGLLCALLAYAAAPAGWAPLAILVLLLVVCVWARVERHREERLLRLLARQGETRDEIVRFLKLLDARARSVDLARGGRDNDNGGPPPGKRETPVLRSLQ